jgi:hypothetical protein
MSTAKFAQAFTIQLSDLPVSCSLNSPPAGVTIELAQIFDATGAATTLGVSASGLSFTIPSTIPTGLGNLEVAVTGGATDPLQWTPVDVVESTTPPTLMGTIVDGNSKFVAISVAVLS